VSERTSAERVPLTSAGRHQLEEELTRLRARLDELRDLLEEAHADRTADDDERAAALALLDEHARAEARMAEVRAILEMAVDAPPPQAGVSGVGTKVTVRETDGAKETFVLVSPAEASPTDGRVSVQSPLGQALVGRRVGEKATVNAPQGSWEVEVVAVEASS
jgi:transcription elongation factor GreA